MNQSIIIQRVQVLLEAAAEHGCPDEITLRHALNENWFSDTLGWLLDPQGDHGLGVKFLQEFLKAVARERCRPELKYARRASHLRWGNITGRGQSTPKLRLGNASSFREFYLAGGVSGTDRGDRYCDVVVLDLDRSDGLVLVVENKLFGFNSKGQLLDQFAGVEERYSRARVREFVYLTLYGDPPASLREREQAILPRWVALSWVNHVLVILEKLDWQSNVRLEEFVRLLRWLDNLNKSIQKDPDAVNDLVCSILDGGVECLLAELNRLVKIGSWSRKTSGTKRLQIFHSSAPKRTLSVSLLNNCSVAIQSKKGRKAQCDKLLLPFGAPARQVYNLLHITTRDLYWIHFGKPKAFIKSLSRRKSLSPEEETFKPLLDFVWRHRFELQGLMGLNSCKKT